MDERSNRNEFCSTTLEQYLDTAVGENEYICQSEVTIPSIEERETNILTIESLSLTELSTENIIPINDLSDDEPLLSIPPIQNNRKNCSKYWLEILVCSIIVFFVTMIIIAGILLTRNPTTSLGSTIGCNKQSETGIFL
jgi:hypothetical protein